MIKLATLSFSRISPIKKLAVPELPEVESLVRLFDVDGSRFSRMGEQARPLVAHFHEYLLRGGFTAVPLVPSVDLAKLLARRHRGQGA